MSSTRIVSTPETFVSCNKSESVKCIYNPKDTIQHNTVYSKTSSNIVKRIASSNISKQSISYNVRDEKNREFYDLFNKKLEVEQ